MNDVCFTCVAFGDQRYIQQQIRLKHSIKAIYPKANLQFYTNALPPNSKEMYESLYGFKVHAVAEARKTYSKVVFLDPAMVLVGKIDRLMNFPIVAVKDDSKLYQTISDKYLKYSSVTREELKEKDWNLVGGSLYYFDFSDAITEVVFDEWALDEEKGYFGSQQEQASEQINSHRNDESCMALNLNLFYGRPQTYDEVGYCTSENAMFTKKHFR